MKTGEFCWFREDLAASAGFSVENTCGAAGRVVCGRRGLQRETRRDAALAA